MKFWLAALILSALMVTPVVAKPHPARPVMIGYIALFKDFKAPLATTDMSRLTHINLAFVNPGPDASITNGEAMSCVGVHNRPPVMAQDIRDIVTTAHASNVKVLASLGGGTIPACSGNWGTLLQPENRAVLVRNLVQFTDDFGLDGLDIDLEWQVLTAIDTAGNYTPFVQELSAALKARGKLLTCATASHEGGMVPVSSLPYFDYVNIMSYDFVSADWGEPGNEHSSLDQAKADLAVWHSRGLPKTKTVLGVPFYGYGFNGYARGYDYRTLIATFDDSASEYDVQGKLCPTCQYITYNGRPTMRAKAKLALAQAAGIMIWELSADATGANSLLQVLDESLNAAQKTAQ